MKNKIFGSYRNFWRSFRRHAHKFEWHINTHNKIRATLKDKSVSGSFCPLTAVYFAKTGKKVWLKNAIDITNGEDWETWLRLGNIIPASDCKKSYSPLLNRLRQQLLRNLGLKENA
jgi:hypothetical protein